jgi:hypothetical protein
MSYNLPLPLRVIQIAGIDGTSAATTAIATTNVGERFIPLYISIQLQSTSGFAVAASLSIGTDGAVSNILPITALTGISAANLMLNLPLVAVISSVAPSTAISVKITTPATATTYILRVALIGYYS